MKMKPIQILVCVCAALWATPYHAFASSKPNLLIIQTDEHNFRTLGCYRALLPEAQAFIWGKGVAVETPNIDWLAEHGAIADRFYATSPVCTPSRASFQTGAYPQNTGAIQNNLPLHDEVVTFAEVLRQNDYRTGYAGKWHLDGPGKPQFAPERKFGWEDNRYMFNRGHWKKLVEDDSGPRVGATNARDQPSYSLDGADEKTFTTDYLTDRAIEFIQRNKARPFCYLVSIPDPHGPNSVRAPYDTMFDHLEFQLPASARSQGESLPAYAATQGARINQKQMADYFGMVKCIDENVGRMLSALRTAGVLDHTIVVFTADHGDLCGEHGRHNKSVPMDGSARVPFVIHAPGVIKPGTVVRQTLGTVDFKPTILALMGVDNPSRDEGRDASGWFTSAEPPDEWKDITFVRIGGGPKRAVADAQGEFAEGSGWFGAFSRQFKLVVAPVSGPSLFDLGSDPDELKNLFTDPDYRETVRRLGRELLAYAQNHQEPLLASPSVRGALEWAVSGTGPYTNPAVGIEIKGKKRTGNRDS